MVGNRFFMFARPMPINGGRCAWKMLYRASNPPAQQYQNRAMFPSYETVYKILYLALRNISKRWTMPIANWSGAMNQFAILFEN